MDKDNIQFTDYALHRMERRGVTREHVWYCVNHHESSEEYCPSKGELVWTTQLPDGRNIKVRIRDGSDNPIEVIDAFSFKGEEN